jgi:hypothetical protein
LVVLPAKRLTWRSSCPGGRYAGGVTRKPRRPSHSGQRFWGFRPWRASSPKSEGRAFRRARIPASESRARCPYVLSTIATTCPSDVRARRSRCRRRAPRSERMAQVIGATLRDTRSPPRPASIPCLGTDDREWSIGGAELDRNPVDFVAGERLKLLGAGLRGSCRRGRRG